MRILVSLSLLTCVGLTACAPDLGHDDYNVSDVGQTYLTTRGVIVSASPIKIHRHSKDNPQGLGMGAAAGALGGSMFGHGDGKFIGMGVGALAGAAIGHAIDSKTRTVQGMSYEVSLENGQTLTISQGAPFFAVGQRVKLLQGGKGHSRDRIVPDNGM